MRTVVLSFSGGLDSSTLLSHLLCHKGYQVKPVIFSYGSKHNEYENQAAKNVLDYMSENCFGCSLLEPTFLDLSPIMSNFNSALMKTGQPIPEGHYNAPTMSQTVVPGRNAIFISILAGIAESIGAQMVAIAIHAGDHHIYPDCRPLFFQYMRDAIYHSTEGRVAVLAPFLYFTKAEIVSHGIDLNVPFHLTRTCYKDQPIACSKCGSCVERLESFEDAGVQDPIDYEKED